MSILRKTHFRKEMWVSQKNERKVKAREKSSKNHNFENKVWTNSIYLIILLCIQVWVNENLFRSKKHWKKILLKSSRIRKSLEIMQKVLKRKAFLTLFTIQCQQDNQSRKEFENTCLKCAKSIKSNAKRSKTRSKSDIRKLFETWDSSVSMHN